jgi:glutamate formiminotransferase
MDADHNRSVITFAGAPEAVAEAALRAVAKAAEIIDLNTHQGVHPRIGATDVLPFVPIEGLTLDDCVQLAASVAEEIWTRLGIPVYLYEAAARRPERKRLENVRRGQFERLRQISAIDPERRPDIGGPDLHPTAGATIVGARPFLIAFNVNLASEDLTVAKDIARCIRTSSGGFPHVKALGLSLERRRQVQVSMNLTDFRQTPIHVVYDSIRDQARTHGVEIAGSEIIGLIPKTALEQAARHYLQVENFSADMVLENKLAEMLPYRMDDVLDEMSDPLRGTGGGRAAALAGTMASALGALVARLMKEDTEPFNAHGQFFRVASDRDAEAFAALIRTEEPRDKAVLLAIDAPLSIAERADRLCSDLRRLSASCPPRYISDVTTAIGLVEAAKAGAVATVELNLATLSDQDAKDAVNARLRRLN